MIHNQIVIKIIDLSHEYTEVNIQNGQQLLRAYFDWLLSSKATSVCYVNSLNPEQEITHLPDSYDTFLIAENEGHGAGCVGFRKLEEDVCEMKRLFVPPQYRGLQIGEQLVEALIQKAKLLGFKTMRLDTIENAMAHAIKIYEKMGFQKIERYNDNRPSGHTLFFELAL